MFVVLIDGKVAQKSDTPIEVASPIQCVEVPAGVEVEEGWDMEDTPNGIKFSQPSDMMFTPPTIKQEAQQALAYVMAQAPQLTVMGEVFGPNTQAYVKTLRAIINGTDTTTTTLPTVPTDLTT